MAEPANLLSFSFGLKQEEIETIHHCLKKELYPTQTLTVWIFGSRASGDFRRYSDIDLLIRGEPVIKKSQFYRMKENLENSTLPYHVDLCLWDELAPAYARQIHHEKRHLITISASFHSETS